MEQFYCGRQYAICQLNYNNTRDLCSDLNLIEADQIILLATETRHTAMRYSGDFDLFTASARHVPASQGGGGGGRYQTGLGLGVHVGGRQINNVFRRAKSTEWDRDVLANNVKDLRCCYT